MRSLIDARARWQATFQNASDLSALRSAVHNRGTASPCVSGLRSVCWKAFLVFENLDQSTWVTIIDESRTAYSSLRDHFLKFIDNPSRTFSIDPLADDEDSPWNALRQDEVLRAEILQDVDRCMPEHPFFREATTKDALLGILFIYCKLNADVGYRQGMHELLAPLFWVISQDAIDRQSDTSGEHGDDLLLSLLDQTFIEHDAFTLFCIVMQTAKSFYESGAPVGNVPQGGSADSPIIARSQRIFNGYLRKTDRELMIHLKEIDILPQIFVLRWIRLLFGREFPFEDLLCLWDLLFAEDPTFKLIDLVSVAMLLRVRWKLLDADYTSALTLLLRYPGPSPEHCPMTFVEDAIYLRSHLSAEGGTHLITKYTGKAPYMNERRARSLHTPHGSTDSTHKSTLRSPTRYLQESGGFESILQEAAKGVYRHGERLGLGQAFKGAVQQLQAVNSSPRRYIAAARRSIDGASQADLGNADLNQRVASLEARNRALAKLLQASMNELTEQTRVLEGENRETLVNNLTLIIAKLQFVHIYLDDPTMPLDEDARAAAQGNSEETQETLDTPAEDEETVTWSPIEARDERGRSSFDQNRATPTLRKSAEKTPEMIRESPTRKYVPRRRPPSGQPSASASTAPHARSDAERASVRVVPPITENEASGSPLQKLRPSLAQSSFSWMLGSDGDSGDRGNFAKATPFSPEHERSAITDRKDRGRAGFLFGEGSASAEPSAGAKSLKDDEAEDSEGFTLGTLRGGERER